MRLTGSRRTLRLPLKLKLLLLGLALLVVAFKAVDWGVEYLWFANLGLTEVFWTLRAAKVALFFCAFVPALAYFWINARLLAANLDMAAVLVAMARHMAGQVAGTPPPPRPQLNVRPGLRAPTPAPLVLLSLAAALVFGLLLYSQWDDLLRFRWAQSFGLADPVFGNDVGFYLFRLPLIEAAQNAVLAASFIVSALLLFAYLYAGQFRIGWSTGIVAPAPMLRHLSVNASLFLLAVAAGHFLDRYDLLRSSGGAVYGAGYADVHATLPGLWVLVGASLVLGLAVLWPQRLLRGVGGVLALAGYGAILVVGLGLVPWFVQAFVVAPNELELETPYLEHNIAFTRRAFGLDRVDERYYDALGELGPRSLADNRATIENIRLWDWRPITQTFRQLQQIRTYYAFYDVDIDRYPIDGAMRQVILSARELATELPGKADTWVNRKLQFTHGYGLVMSQAATMSVEGTPVLVLQDLPPRSEVGLEVSEPAIYYGEGMDGYRIVSTAVEEFDHPRGDENVYVRYRGRGGVSIGSFWRRLLFAWHQFDPSILLTGYIQPDSRIQLWREVKSRVGRIAPFLKLDRDPYLVLSDGRLYWIQDAYTVARAFPYAEPFRRSYNYIRNSVKVVVDAYHGDVAAYVIDPDDPVLQVYRAAMPGLFRPIEAMPANLQRHLRYPLELFEAQVEIFSTYHMTVPQVFYNREDQWAAPNERYGGEQISMKPYYVLMRLPGERQLQFLLMTPMAPRNRDNMIAWMAARSDLPGYGELVVYKLPKERLILGPIQVEAMIDQDTLVSQQLSLWDQRGSRVIRGNLLVVPVDHAFLYVEPVYLIAEGTNIPQLKRVIASDGKRLAMEPTLDQALATVFGGTVAPARAPAAAGPARPDARVPQARGVLAEAERALGAGDWDAFGRAMQRLRDLLGE